MAKKISQVVESVDEKLDILFGDLTKKFEVILEKAGCQAEVEESESESPDGSGFDTDPKKVTVKATKFGDKEKGKKSKADKAGFDADQADDETYDDASKDVVQKDKNKSKVEVKECDQVSDETYDQSSKDVVRKDKNKSKVDVKEADEECDDEETDGEDKEGDDDEELDESNNGGYGTDGQKEGNAEPTADEFEGDLVKGKKAGFEKNKKAEAKGDDTPKNSKETRGKTAPDLANAKGTKGDDTPKNSKETRGKVGTDLAAQKGAKGEETPKNAKESNAKIVAKEGAMSIKDIGVLVTSIGDKLKKSKKPSDVLPVFKSIADQFAQDNSSLKEKQIYTLKAIDKQLV